MTTSRGVLGENGRVGSWALDTVFRVMDGEPAGPWGASSWPVLASDLVMALAIRADCSADRFTTVTSMITVFSGVDAVTVEASAAGVVSSSSESITGCSTAGIVASWVYDCTSFSVKVKPCTSSLVVSPRGLETKTLLVARYRVGSDVEYA